MLDCMRTIARKEGISSFYRGVVPSVLKTTISTGLAFSFFRFAKNSLEFLHDGGRP
jgi:anti-anti-sigma regulatory factor